MSNQLTDISTAGLEPATTLNRRWRQIFGAVIMNLAFGNMYAWSVFVAPLEKQFRWSRADTSVAFTVAVCMTAFTSWLSGWIYDKWGPAFCVFAGGLLASSGFFLSAFSHTLMELVLYFGVIGGFGTGLGCTALIAVVAKWFPDKRGLAVGLVVAAFGASSAIFGPLAETILIPQYGFAATFEVLGATFFVMTMAGAFLMKDPPGGYQPTGWAPEFHKKASPSVYQFTSLEMLQTSSFYLLWLGYALGCASGLMVISQLVPYLRSRNLDSRALAAVMLVLGALASILGRVLSGWMSDILGRLYVLRLMVAISAIAMPVLYAANSQVALLYAMVAVVYFCYGTQFSVNAATCADLWGVKHVGLNYGLFITAWGVGGIIGPRIGGLLYDKYHNYHSAFLTAGLLAAIALVFELLAKRPLAPIGKRLVAGLERS